jgi:hypothetical protein
VTYSVFICSSENVSADILKSMPTIFPVGNSCNLDAEKTGLVLELTSYGNRCVGKNILKTVEED